MKKEATLGNVQDIFLPQVNNNFDDLYCRSGSRMQRFLTKAATPSFLLKDETVRVCVVGDSVMNTWKNSSLYILDMLPIIYPNATFEFKDIIYGGTGNEYINSSMWDIINWNPDLVIYMDYESIYYRVDFSRIILRELRNRTSSDIAIVPYTILRTGMEFIQAKNFSGWLDSTSYQIRMFFEQLASDFNAEFIDIHEIIIKYLWDGTYTVDRYYVEGEGVHPGDNYWIDAYPAILRHFGDNNLLVDNKVIVNKQLFNNYSNGIVYKYFSEAIYYPDLTSIIKNGTWAANNVTVDKSNTMLTTSEASAYVETTFFGTGFELAYINNAVGEFKIEIGLNGGVLASPSNLLKDYASIIYNYPVSTPVSINGPLKVIVDSNILSNSEESRIIEIETTSSTAYKVTDITNSTLLGTGIISNDGVFSCTGGQFTIPAYYSSALNFRGSIVTGTKYRFYIKKNWFDAVITESSNSTGVIRIFGLQKSTHTLRITHLSGTISLDSIMELK